VKDGIPSGGPFPDAAWEDDGEAERLVVRAWQDRLGGCPCSTCKLEQVLSGQ